MIVVLLGYMASGKSTIGKIIAKEIGYDFIDLDDYIEKKERNMISSIFNTKGEIYFRRKEALYLSEILNNNSELVLSLGGGTPCYAGNMNKILDIKNAKSFYLKASIPTILKRLKKEENKRPLISHLTHKDDLTEFIGKHLFERTQFYNQANHQVITNDKSVEVVADEIIKLF